MIDVEQVLAWYGVHRRDLPWRSSTPYGVVSEFMLQQTPVMRVLPMWHAWMERWPDFASLSAASRGDVLRAWGALGYPRRAVRLHELAATVVRDHAGILPDDEQVLRTLPGVGEYTAAAIVAFAFERPAIVLDVNVRRVLLRAELGINAPAGAIGRVERELAQRLLPTDDGHIWAAASMELGALVCTARTPACDACPLAHQCAWRAADYPVTVFTKGQAWRGTDRQCRGALMKVVRQSDQPVTKAELDAVWSVEEQRERCLAQLTREGLIEPLPHQMFRLPD
jgi:A/G-specific adenine glycosylase